MKIAIITIHVGSNFGSILQTIATCQILKQAGADPVIINYIPDRVTYKRYFKEGFQSVKRLIRRICYFPFFLLDKKIYSGYLTKYVKLSSPIYQGEDFFRKCPSADIYMTGSDQVWNSIHNEGYDGHYYFEGFPEEIRRVAFCSSIGREDFDETEKSRVAEELIKYKAISVREDSAVEILSKLGIESTQIIDPTFLLDRIQWRKFMSQRIVKEPYVLIYTPYNTVDENVIYASAKKLAEKYNLKIVTFSWTFKNDPRANRTVKFASPGDFLSLMYYADFIITNSFHGTAFSINFNKNFWVFQPNAFSTRIESILRKTGLINRMLFSELTNTNLQEIEYSRVNSIIEQERNFASNFLEKALN